MGFKCKKPNIIKNKFKSSEIGTLGIFLAIGFLFPLGSISVYVTSYIHYSQTFVTMHYSYFFYLIINLSSSFSTSFGGILENKIGFNFTTILGTIIVLIGNIFFFKIQNIWISYGLALIMGIGMGIANSLLIKNLALYVPKKKGFITSIFGLFQLAFDGIYLITGEKIIALGGETLKKGQEFYSEEIANRTYYYFMIGFFSIPVGDIIFLLFTYEYDKTKKGDIIVPQNDNDNKDENIDNNQQKNEENYNDNNTINDSNDEQNEIKDKKINENEKKEDEEKNNSKSEENEVTDDLIKKKAKKMLKTFRFWRLALTVFFLSFSSSFLNIIGRAYGAIIGVKGAALQFLVLVKAGAIGLFGPFLGCLADKKSPLLVLRISAIINIIPGILLFFFDNNTLVYLISFTIMSLGSAAKLVSLNPLLMEIYGIRESVILGGIIQGVGTLNEIISTVSAFVISLFYHETEIEDPYKLIFICGSVSSGLSFILFLFESKKKYDIDDESDKLIDNEKIEQENV